jgi:hypothetical protein
MALRNTLTMIEKEADNLNGIKRIKHYQTPMERSKA